MRILPQFVVKAGNHGVDHGFPILRRHRGCGVDIAGIGAVGGVARSHFGVAGLGQRLLDGTAPWRVRRQSAQHRLPCRGRFLGATLLRQRHGQVETGLRIGRIELQGCLESILGIGRDNAACRAGDRLSETGLANGAVAIKPNGVAIGIRRVGKALHAQIDRGKHVPAPAIGGIGGQMGFGPRHQFVDRTVGGILGQPLAERL